ncbi:uncharacterized protein [Phyllobates terribilis]|uniref:uncharacterized protein isoform X2 n=1 Tax=Phyllobates terribilis TaxID=111132 RepID=UPI003CCB28D1
MADMSEDMSEDAEICQDCEKIKSDDVTFHLLYCYDAYIVSPPCPQSIKQKGVDIHLYKSIVTPLEQRGYKCYYGSRDIIGGDHIIQAMSYPITIIPTTIVPVFKDEKFTSLRNLLLRPDYLERVVFLLFDKSQVYPEAISKNGYSLVINDRYLLSKLIQTIKKNRMKTPLFERKMKYEKGPNAASSISSIPTEISIEGGYFLHAGSRGRINSHGSRSWHAEEAPENALSSKMQQLQESRCFSPANDAISLEDLKATTSPDVLLSQCYHYDKKISHFAARTLTKLIQKGIGKFYRNVNLLSFETGVRKLLEKDYMKNCEVNCFFEKLYFWILAAIYIRIYKCNDSDLKYHVKTQTLKWHKTSPNPFAKFYQNNYLKLTISLIARIKTWPNQLEKNNTHVRMLENAISLLDQNDFQSIVKATNMNTVIKYLSQLPCDIKHIFVVIITEKIFEKKYTESYIHFFYDICASVRDKHQEIYLDVMERTTEYIQEKYTKGELTLSVKLLEMMWEFLKDGKRKDKKLMTMLKHFFKKLVYHPVTEVRNFVVPLLFSEDLNGIDMSQLGSSCIIVDEDLLKACIREKLSIIYPDMVVHDQLPTTAENVLLFDATIQDDHILVHLLRQKTLNDILQTNSTDSACERFQEVSEAVSICQGHANIVILKKNHFSNGILPLFMVEHGKPLLQFLHENENQLTWFQMIEILTGITMAVQHCHENNIILCDITPASFIVTMGSDGSYIIKLSNFLYSKCIPYVEKDDSSMVYNEVYNTYCVDGDYKQPLATYFSAPETLTGNYFSKSTEVWMLAATIYSILLYGRQPFEELCHLGTSLFVREITSCHTPQIPGCFLPDLRKILSASLNHKISNRMPILSILEELRSLKSTLGAKGNEIHYIKSICPCINPKDIHMVCGDLKVDFIKEKKELSTSKVFRDSCKRNKDRLYEVVSVRMGKKTRQTIKTLNHVNILPVEEITKNSYTTKLMSVPFDSHSGILKRNDCNINLHELLSYFEQIVTALHYLHSQNILHCDLRCSYMYINPQKGTLKVGHFGRAVFLENNQHYVLKMMPPDAAAWSAPEVKMNGMYSYSSDIYNLASVFWEALNTRKKFLLSLPDNSKLLYENLVESPDSYPYCIDKLMSCMKECFNVNPTKRPTLEYIGKVIKQLKKEDQRWPDEKTCAKSLSCKETEGETYEDVTSGFHNPDSSVEYSWNKVIYELESGIVEYTTLHCDTYQNMKTDCSKAIKREGTIL